MRTLTTSETQSISAAFGRGSDFDTIAEKAGMYGGAMGFIVGPFVGGRIAGPIGAVAGVLYGTMIGLVGGLLTAFPIAAVASLTSRD